MGLVQGPDELVLEKGTPEVQQKYLRARQKGHTEVQRRPLKMEAETAAVSSQAKELQEPLEAGGSRKDSARELLEGTWPGWHLGVRPQGLQDCASTDRLF